MSRYSGNIKMISIDILPICPVCKTPMGICKRARTTLVGKDCTYDVSIPTYGCRHKHCTGHLGNLVTPPNPYAAPHMTFDYEVQAEVSYIRWQEHATYEEISKRLLERYGIVIDRMAIETTLKCYEIGCAKHYRSFFFDQIKEHGGVLVHLDVIEPLKGKNGFLIAYDHWTGLTLNAKRMLNGSQLAYESFLIDLKERIKTEINVPILGIISDALKEQRKAIERIMPEVPHCLCHYHFYDLVLKQAKLSDSSLVTQIREDLRRLYDLKQFKIHKQNDTLENTQYESLKPLFDVIEELSDWRRKPKDPCFTGLVLYKRLKDIQERFIVINKKIEENRIMLTKRSVIVMKRMISETTEILDRKKTLFTDLNHVTEHISCLTKILDDADSDEVIGCKKINEFDQKLLLYQKSIAKTTLEYEFITSFHKFISTKGELLFNYRKIDGAPSTNNFQELKFKQLKHLLRRIIGHSAAKEFLFAHGEGIVYVNPDESREKIIEIFKLLDQSLARKEIRDNRNSRDSLVIVIHDQKRWAEKLNELDQYITLLETKLNERS
jgi:hypothetical protein